MAIKKRLLATAALPFLALAGAGLSAHAAPAAGIVRAPLAIEAKSPIISVQSEEEEVPRKRRNRENQAEDQQGGDEGGQQRQRRKERQQAQEQQMEQPAENAEEPVRRNRKERQQAQEDQGFEQQPDNAQAEEQPRKKRRENQQAQQDDGGVSDEEIINQNRKARKERQQAQEQEQQQQQIEEAQPSNDAEAEEQPRRKRQQAEGNNQRQNANEGEVSDEEIMNQNRKNRKQRQQGEEQQQMDEAQPSDNADAEEQPRRKRRDQQAEGENQRQNAEEVSDDEIMNQNQRRKNRDRANTPEAIEKREQIARDPSKTTDTVVLPVENGAAVLDSDKDADNSGANRERRKRQREEIKEVRVPKSDKDAQKIDIDINIKPVIELKGERVDDFRGYRRPEGKLIGKGDDVRVVFDLDGKVVIRSDDRDRIGRNEQIRYERLRDERIKEIVVRPNGDRIVTVRNRWGEIIRRSRINASDVEVVIFYSPDLDQGRDRLFLRDPGDDLPPMRLNVPIDDYIIDVSSRNDRDYDYEEFLAKPPVEQVERVYSVDEVKNSARIRDKVRRIDLDTITFETGSADIDREQASTLRDVAKAINDLLDRNPGETFLIEGHTDAVGSDESNLVLSDERAESVANVLTELFDIPAENLTTQGYGERYLKIDSDGAVRENRRVTIRRITPLVRPAELSEN